ncbi:MAG: SLBB domain-containing protein, partial [Limisphaerales bacterium]
MKKAFFRFLSLAVFGILTATLAQGQMRRDTLRTQAPATDRTPLEAAVDSNLYVVGPGDELTIGLWGAVNQILTVPVTPEGTALIPSVGEARLGGLTLAQAKKEVRTVLSRRYSATDASVTLTKIRQVIVRVSGGVANPGVYAVAAYSWASEAIARAGGLAEGASRRNIELLRQSGEKKPVDLLRFERTGEGTANPRILEGDRIVVPARRPARGDILVAGQVSFGGLFEARPDDSLKTLLSVAGGLLPTADSNTLERVWTTAEGEAQRETVDLRELNPEDLPIRPGEQILVRSRPGLTPRGYASVQGEVRAPGFYDIEEGKTKVSEIIARAGGFTPRAVLSAAFILRQGYSAPLFSFGDAINPALIERMNPEDLDFYLEKSRWRGAVVACDFVGLFEKKDLSKDVVLYSGDEVQVPQTSGSVYVLGRVARPGLLSYAKGGELEDYVRRAGG